MFPGANVLKNKIWILISFPKRGAIVCVDDICSENSEDTFEPLDINSMKGLEASPGCTSHLSQSWEPAPEYTVEIFPVSHKFN